MPRILLVEDEFLVRLTLVEVLGDEGFEVVEAENAEEALRQLAADGISLLMTDIHLPGGVDGRQLAQRARERHPKLPVIFMTGRPDTAPKPQGGAPEMVIAKPYLPSDIAAAVHRMLGEG